MMADHSHMLSAYDPRTKITQMDGLERNMVVRTFKPRCQIQAPRAQRVEWQKRASLISLSDLRHGYSVWPRHAL